MKHATLALVFCCSFLACQKSDMPGPSAPNGQGGQTHCSSGIRPAPQLRSLPGARIIDHRSVRDTYALLEKWQHTQASRNSDSLPALKQKH
ncbi:MAG: hypothetical protein JST06_10040 [Bacteroidetes bacterium]|nr:hypothetical protein [Bacteroidota bacterium]